MTLSLLALAPLVLSGISGSTGGTPPPGNSGSELHGMHDAVASFGAVVVEDWVYVTGGHIGQVHVHSQENLSPALVRYAVDDLSHREVLPAEAKLQSVALVAHGGVVYRVGGLAAHNETGFDDEDLHSTDEVARLDPETGLWVPAFTLPIARSSHDAIVHDGTLYVFGGWRMEGDDGEFEGEGFSLDMDAEGASWRHIDQPFRRRALAVAAAAGRVWCIGGLTEDGMMSREVDVYDIASGTWSKGPELPCRGFGVTAIGHGNQIYVAGSDGMLYAPDDEGTAWLPRGEFATSRIFARLVALPGERLALFGGVGEGSHLALVEELRRTRERPRPIVAHASFPFPGEGRQRHAAFVHEDWLYLFGGNKSAEAHRFGPEDFSTQGWRVNLLSGEAQERASLPAPRQSMEAVLGTGMSPKAYLAGGFASTGGEARAWDQVFVYDLKADSFSTAPAHLPRPLTHFGMTSLAGRLYAVGGLVYDEEGNSEVAAGIASWHPVAQKGGFEEAGVGLAPARRAFAGVEFGGEYVIIGGLAEGFEILGSGIAIDLETGESRAFPAPTERPRVSGTLVPLDDRLLLVGGSSDAGLGLEPDPRVEVFDPETQTWSVLVEELPFEDPRHIHAFPWRDRVVVVTAARAGDLDVAWIEPD